MVAIETLYGEILEIAQDTSSVDDIKCEISKKYGYPIDKQYLHHNGKNYVMIQFSNETSFPEEVCCPFIKELIEYGCPPKLVEHLYSKGYTKEMVYHDLLPGLCDNELVKNEMSKNKKPLDISKFSNLMGFVKSPSEFKENRFLKLLSENDVNDIFENENEYCEKVIEEIMSRDSE